MDGIMNYENMIKEFVRNYDISNDFSCRFSFKTFDMWLKGKTFKNMDTRKSTDYNSLPEKQKKKIKNKYDEYVNVERMKNKKLKKVKPLTEAQVRRLGVEAGKSLRETGLNVDETAYEAAVNSIGFEPGLKEFFEAKGVKESWMASAFADYIK